MFEHLVTMAAKFLESALVAAIVGAIVGSVCSGIVSNMVAKRTTRITLERQHERQMTKNAYTALLLARELRLWASASALGQEEEVTQRAESIHVYLSHLQIAGVTIPTNPADDTGAGAADFIRRLFGRLEASSLRASTALMLGWNALNLPRKAELEWIDTQSEIAGFPQRRDDEKAVEYLQRLMDEGKALLQ